MSFLILLHNKVVSKDIPALSSPEKRIIQKAIREKLSTKPLVFGKPLQYSFKGHRVLRVGKYRVVFRIESATQREKEKTVYVLAIIHRKAVYSEIKKRLGA